MSEEAKVNSEGKKRKNTPNNHARSPFCVNEPGTLIAGFANKIAFRFFFFFFFSEIYGMFFFYGTTVNLIRCVN